MQKPTETHIAELYLSKHLSDITLFIGQNKLNSCKIPAHQLVLCAGSPVFTAMFNGNYDESEKKEVLIKDIAPYVFHKLLMFLYTGILHLTSMSEALDVLHAADKYEINKLKHKCFEEIIKLKLSLEDFWKLFANFISFGDQLTSREMKIHLFHYLDTNALEVIKHGKFALLDKISLLKIISRDTFFVQEIDLCEALVNWAKIQCCANCIDPTVENQRSALGDGLYQIRILSMPIETLQNLSLFELFTPAEKEHFIQTPNKVLSPWNYDLIQKQRKREWNFRSCINPFMSTDYTTTYFVFAKDAYLSNIEIWLENENDNVSKVIISALGKNGSKTAVKNTYRFDSLKPILNISSICITAFRCYKLVIEPKNLRAIVYDDDFNSWGYDDDGEAVFFSISEDDVTNIDKFCSTDYWKTVFARKPPVHDDDVILRVITSSCILNASAIFC